MATAADILIVREYVNEPTPELYSDQRISDLIDGLGGDLRKTAATIWSSKASRFATLVDTQEGSSSRKLGSLYKQALEMSTHWGTPETGEIVVTQRPSRTRPIVRP